MRLRPYQVEGQRDIFNAWSETDIVMFVLATGGGKTVTFVDVEKQFLAAGKRCLLIAHRVELINQAWDTLYANKIYSGTIMGSAKTNYELLSQVGSIQTLIRRKLPPIDLLIIDEGHHVTKSNSYGKLIERVKRDNPGCKVLMVTATPYRMDGTGFRNVYPHQETKLVVNRTLLQLQKEGYLVRFRYFASQIPDFTNVSKLSTGEYEEEGQKNKIKIADIISSYEKHAKGLQGLVFAVDVAHSKEIRDKYREIGVNAEHLDATTPADERADILSRFKSGEIQIITNVGIATEGTDVPNCHFVQLARRVVSLSLYFQMVGRVSRTVPGTVDGPDAQYPEQRLARIESSAKPYGIVLDNAGCFEENPEIALNQEIDWHVHFNGKTKSKKREQVVSDQIEILIYEAEDANGNRIKTKNVHEIEGLELIEITKEMQPRVVTMVSLKEFDKQYSLVRNIRHIKKKGWVALDNYIKYCKSKGYDIPETAWEYIKQRLVTDINDRVMAEQKRITDTFGSGALLESSHKNTIQNIRNLGLTSGQMRTIMGIHGIKTKV